MSVEQFLEATRNAPECFKCRKPITEFNDVRVIIVRVDGEPESVWVHANHASPDWVADELKPHDKRMCRNCHTEIEWASQRPEEGWEYDWYHLPVIIGRRTGDRRCPIYAEPA